MSPLSLKASLLDIQPHLAATAVSPKGFKTALQSFVQFLISQQVPASLWVKLPKDDAWWQDVWQYGQQAAGCCIYTLGEQTGNPPDTLAASLRTIAIEQTPELKREYLCMAIAENFVGVLFAARTDAKTAPGDKRTLQLFVSTAPKTAVALSKGIKSIIEENLPQIDEKNSDSFSDSAQTLQARASQLGDQRFIAGAAALSQWDRCFPPQVMSQPTLPLSEAFLAWQLQFQEALRSQLSEQRSLAKGNQKSGLQGLSADFLTQAKEALQSPLTTIKTALTLLGSPSLKLAQKQRYLEMISTQCEQQRTLIDSITNLLQLQTTQRGKTEVLHLSDLVPGLVSTYQPLAEERGIMLAYTVPEGLPSVKATETELKQVIIYLLRNGIQTTLKGGRVWVAATAQDSNFVALSIQDGSSGIAKSDLSRVFEPFSQLSMNTGESDTGLEFALIQQLVQRTGGEILVESTLNQGTTFTVLLPIASPQPDTSQPDTSQPDVARSEISAIPASESAIGEASQQESSTSPQSNQQQRTAVELAQAIRDAELLSR